MNRLLSVSIVLALGACSSGPSAPAQGRAAAKSDAASLVAQVREAGRSVAEIEVQPLRDPQVQDLRDRAETLEAQGRYRDAEAPVDQALAISTGDPDLLQWKAELSMYRKDWAAAERLAAESYERGPRVGGLCRRNWAATQHARAARGDAAGAGLARQRIGACTVAPPVRM